MLLMDETVSTKLQKVRSPRTLADGQVWVQNQLEDLQRHALTQLPNAPSLLLCDYFPTTTTTSTTNTMVTPRTTSQDNKTNYRFVQAEESRTPFETTTARRKAALARSLSILESDEEEDDYDDDCDNSSSLLEREQVSYDDGGVSCTHSHRTAHRSNSSRAMASAIRPLQEEQEPRVSFGATSIKYYYHANEDDEDDGNSSSLHSSSYNNPYSVPYAATTTTSTTTTTTTRTTITTAASGHDNRHNSNYGVRTLTNTAPTKTKNNTSAALALFQRTCSSVSMFSACTSTFTAACLPTSATVEDEKDDEPQEPQRQTTPPAQVPSCRRMTMRSYPTAPTTTAAGSTELAVRQPPPPTFLYPPVALVPLDCMGTPPSAAYYPPYDNKDSNSYPYLNDGEEDDDSSLALFGGAGNNGMPPPCPPTQLTSIRSYHPHHGYQEHDHDDNDEPLSILNSPCHDRLHNQYLYYERRNTNTSTGRGGFFFQRPPRSTRLPVSHHSNVR
ncbi:hypothetical protein ACA910_004666 [Epithemia clementina (nom. ined.)]